MLSKIEETRERNRLRVDYQNTMDLTAHLSVVRRRAPDYKVEALTENEKTSWQECINAACWRLLGDAWTRAALYAIENGILTRQRRSWSGRALETLFLPAQPL